MHEPSSGVSSQERRVLIIGGGFGGVRTALSLAKMRLPNLRITLVSDKHHFEYTPSLYKLATGRSPQETCIPLGDIFGDRKIEYVVDTIISGSLADKSMLGASGVHYHYDFLVLALGAETSYFNIPGIEENSFTLKTVASSLKLKSHLHSLFRDHGKLSKGELISQFQFVIVGGGPAGVELAGEIRRYARKLAAYHGVSQKLVTVDIIQAVDRLLPTMPPEVSARAARRLTDLGINVILNRPVTGEDLQGVYLKDIQFNAKTIIWTAGVRASHIYTKIAGLTLDKGGRILVDEHLRAKGVEGVFAIGDSASTPFSGTAQTAIYDGHYAAEVVAHTIAERPMPNYKPKMAAYVVPIGPNWAVFNYKKIVLSGRIFWWLRLLIDFRFFLSILPPIKAFTIWRAGGRLSETCPTCRTAEEESRIS